MAALGLVKARCRFFATEGGNSSPWCLFSSGFGSNKSDLARAAVHEQENNALGLRGKVPSLPALPRAFGSRITAEQRPELLKRERRHPSRHHILFDVFDTAHPNKRASDPRC